MLGRGWGRLKSNPASLHRGDLPRLTAHRRGTQARRQGPCHHHAPPGLPPVTVFSATPGTPSPLPPQLSPTCGDPSTRNTPSPACMASTSSLLHPSSGITLQKGFSQCCHKPAHRPSLRGDHEEGVR